MSDDIKTFVPRITNCPYCGERADGEQWVDVLDETDSTVPRIITDHEDFSHSLSYDTTRCIRFVPCGHAFEEESIESIVDSLRELRSLRLERRRCEIADRLKDLDYEIEAQIHAVNNRASEAVRREQAEQDT